MLSHFVSERRERLFLGAVPLMLCCPIPVVRSTLIVTVSPIAVNLEPQCFFGKFWAFKNVAKVCRTDQPVTLVSLLEPILATMSLLNVKFEVVISLKLLLAESTLVNGGFD